MHSHCFILYAFSCLLFATGASGIVWDLLLNLRNVHSKRTIKESMLQIGQVELRAGKICALAALRTE